MNREQIKDKVIEIWGNAVLKFPKIKSIPIPTVQFFSKSSVAGKAFYEEFYVSFNEILALENSEEFSTTIAHELAHLITYVVYPNFKQHHGPEFKSVMEKLGYDYRTYHTYNTSSVSTKRVKTRYEYVCTKCMAIHEVATPTHNKMQAAGTDMYGLVKGWKCKCGNGIKFTGNVKKFV